MPTTIDRGIMDPDLEAAARRFVEDYNRTFEANRADLVDLYREDSLLTLDGEKLRGKEAILAKLTSLPFQQCQHLIATLDCLPASDGGVHAVVSGYMRLDGKEDARVYTQFFILMPTPEGSFYVSNEIFQMTFKWREDGVLA